VSFSGSFHGVHSGRYFKPRGWDDEAFLSYVRSHAIDCGKARKNDPPKKPLFTRIQHQRLEALAGQPVPHGEVSEVHVEILTADAIEAVKVARCILKKNKTSKGEG
jgi:hypothetical protein